MSEYRCPRCISTPREWSGDDRKCSFGADGIFTNKGWNCATMNALRKIAGDTWNASGDHLRYCTRTNDESIGVVYDGEYGFIVMTWYKNRGRTGMAVYMVDEQTPTLLTLAQAEEAITYHNPAAREETKG